MKKVSEWLKALEEFDKYLQVSQKAEPELSLNSGLKIGSFSELYSTEIAKLKNQSARFKGVLNEYLSRYGDQEVVVVSSPGRAELLGNYQDNLPIGHTLSAAITLDVIAVAGKNNGRISARSMQFIGETLDSRLEDLPDAQNCTRDGWTPFPIGIVRTVKERYALFEGANIVLDGEVPLGSGCSSSAALENAIVFSINQLYGLQMDINEMAQISKISENKFKGKGCGYLDQLTSLVGGLVYIDYSNPERPSFKRLDTPWFSGWSLITAMVDEGHAQEDGAYNTIGPDLMQVYHAMGADIMKGQVKVFKSRILNQVTSRTWDRGLFYVEEYTRVQEGMEALARGDAVAFGRCMDGSGDGSRLFLGNTNPAIDKAVSLVRDYGAHARVHGGGFKGGPIILTDDTNKIMNVLGSEYGPQNVLLHGIRPGAKELMIFAN